MFSRKNEFQAVASAGTAFNVRTAYSFTDQWGLTASYLYTDDRGLNERLDGDQWRIHSVGEFGIGYYTYTKKNFYIDFFSGAGLGKGRADNIITTSMSRGPLNTPRITIKQTLHTLKFIFNLLSVRTNAFSLGIAVYG